MALLMKPGNQQVESLPQQSELAREISTVLARKGTGNRERHSFATRSVLSCSLFMLALGPAPVGAVGLGELTTHSTLGQPLRATVPLRLGNEERVSSKCITTTGGAASGLKGPAKLTLKAPRVQGPGNFVLELGTRVPVHEPMYEFSVRVDCPGTAAIQRQYVLMLDLPSVDAASAPLVDRRTVPASLARPDSSRTTTPAGAAAQTRISPPRVAASYAKIPAGSLYRVSQGDTLSTIAARTENRPLNSTWQLADLIYAANPSAFIAGDPNRIKLGTEIRMPTAADWGETGATRTSASRAAAAPVSARRPRGIETTIPAVTNRQPEQAQVRTAPQQNTVALPPKPVSQSETASPGSSSPFADENAPSANATPEQTSAAQTQLNAPENPAVGATDTEANGAELSPIFATLLGALIGLGAGLGLLFFGGRLLEIVTRLFRRNRRNNQAKKEEDTFLDTDAWLNSSDEMTVVVDPVANPADDTYVVEVSDADTTSNPFAEIMEARSEAEKTQIALPPRNDKDVETQASEDSWSSAQTVEQPGIEHSIDTVMTEVFDDALSDISSESELPDEAFSVPEEGDDTTLMPEADELTHLSGATVDEFVDLDVGELSDEMLVDDATQEMTREAMAIDAESDQVFSSTLQDALALLEEDYGEDLDSSQVILESDPFTLDDLPDEDTSFGTNDAKKKAS